MAGTKVHELAKEFGMSSNELLEHLKELSIPAKSHATSLVDAYVDIIREHLAPLLAERQAEIEKARAAEEAKEQARLAAEEEKKQEELRERQAREAELRREHEEERAAREAEQARLEQQELQAQAQAEAQAQAQAPAQAQAQAQAAQEQAPASAQAPAPQTPAPASAPEPEQPAPGAAGARTKKTKQEKATQERANKRKNLEETIAAEAARLEAAAAAKHEAEEAERYRNMALEAEKLETEKVLAQMRAEIEAAQRENQAKKKKKEKERAEAGDGGKEQPVAGAKSKKKKGSDAAEEASGGLVVVEEGVTVGDFAAAVGASSNDLIKTLFMLGTPLTVNQPLTNELIELLADDLGREIEIRDPEAEMTWTFEDAPEDLLPRSPVVTVMGHVDHGKTSLLDAIRETGVAEAEAGGITQHIGASVVEKNGRKITFIDTPGHEAFTAMRARGANITDIVILVVAADDGVMPQTIEAINHAKAADVPIVVAVNKIDKDNANPDTVRQMLTEYEVIPEEWGGKNIFVNISAKKRIGIDDLLEMVLLQADILELKANPDAPAFGTVIEAKLDKGRGPVATVLVQRGTLRVGDTLVAGTAFGHVRALLDDKGRQVKTAGPSDPAEIIGLQTVPASGDEFCVFTDERAGRALADERAMKQRLRAQESARSHISLENLFETIEAGELKELNLILKTDVQGSIEALRDAFEKMDQTEVRITVVHAAVGAITETDVALAAASNAIIIGFNVRSTPKAKLAAAEEHVDVRLYSVIYQAIEEINAARVGLLAPEFKEQETAQVEVRDLFRVPKAGVIAGSYVQEGEIHRDDQVRVVRDGTVIFEGVIGSLRRFKEDVKSVRSGYECGVGVEGYQDLKVGDIIEGFVVIEVARES
ncbi:MAG: translation initiation factor IF-2 [Coriobacteriia bacterium]|nr:translation initiation factor IF-2 [Coriobacteriia bacterium]